LTYRRVSHFEEGKNSSPVVGDGNITDIVHEHLVESAARSALLRNGSQAAVGVEWP
jgi:hypothetical protein